MQTQAVNAILDEEAAAPQLRAGVTIERTAISNESIVFDADSGRYFNMGEDASRVLPLLDGTRTIGSVSDELAVDRNEIAAFVQHLSSHGLLAHVGQSIHASAPTRRLTVEFPKKIQLTLMERPRFLRPGGFAARVAGSRLVALTLITVAMIGAMVLAKNGVPTLDDLPSGLGFSGVAGMMIAMMAINWVHELAHGARLAALGKVPRRLGIMLFYISPAMFCDVTDTWSVSSPRQRASVALAGPLVHAASGGIAALLAAAVPGPSPALIGLSFVCYLLALVNLCPLIELDGYFALCTFLDIPNLRSRSIRDLGATARSVLDPDEHRKRALSAWWLPYAILAVILPVFIYFGVLRTLRNAILLSDGANGRYVWLAVAVAGSVYLLRTLAKKIQTLDPISNRARKRGLVLGLASLAIVVTASSLVQIERTTTTLLDKVEATDATHIQGRARRAVPQLDAEVTVAWQDPARLFDRPDLGRVVKSDAGTITIRGEQPFGGGGADAVVESQQTKPVLRHAFDFVTGN